MTEKRAFRTTRQRCTHIRKLEQRCQELEAIVNAIPKNADGDPLLPGYGEHWAEDPIGTWRPIRIWHIDAAGNARIYCDMDYMWYSGAKLRSHDPTPPDNLKAAEKIVFAESNDGLDSVDLVAIGIEYGRAQATVEAPSAESEFAKKVRHGLGQVRITLADGIPLEAGESTILEIASSLFFDKRQGRARALYRLLQIAITCQRTAEDCGLLTEAKHENR